MTTADYGFIQVRGARENNLKDVVLDIPKRKITVFTGVSGSGKSSLVFDTIAAESQRLINETYTAFLQRCMPGYGQPDVDSLENLSAAIIVDQKRLGGNSRSTVGTVTDTYSMLRLLFSRLGNAARRQPGRVSFNDPQRHVPGLRGPRRGRRRSTSTRWSTATSRSTRARSCCPASPWTPGSGRSSRSPASSTTTRSCATTPRRSGTGCSYWPTKVKMAPGRGSDQRSPTRAWCPSSSGST